MSEGDLLCQYAEDTSREHLSRHSSGRLEGSRSEPVCICEPMSSILNRRTYVVPPMSTCTTITTTALTPSSNQGSPKSINLNPSTPVFNTCKCSRTNGNFCNRTTIESGNRTFQALPGRKNKPVMHAVVQPSSPSSSATEPFFATEHVYINATHTSLNRLNFNK